MTKHSLPVFAVYMLVSSSVGVFAALILIFVEDIAVLRPIGQLAFSAIITSVILGVAFAPIFLKIREVTRALTAINRNKSAKKVDELPVSVLSDFIGETNTLIERHGDFNAMRGRLYEQISEVAAQEERNRLARDLHDSIKQQVFSMSVSAAAAQAHLETNQEAARAALLDVRQSAQEAMVEMRALLQQLAPAPLEQSGLIEALRQQMEALSYRTGAGIQTAFDQMPSDDILPIGAQETLFRIAQEALSNVARHARAKRVDLQLRISDDQTLTLTIEDDGQGFDMDAIKRGMGLNNIERRVREFAGADIQYESSIGAGTTLTITIPLLFRDDIGEHKKWRKEARQLLEGTQNEYSVLAGGVAAAAFASLTGLRSVLLGNPVIVGMVMGTITLIGVVVAGWFYQRYQRKYAKFLAFVPDKHDALHHKLHYHKSQSQWLVLFAVTFALPTLFIHAIFPVWMPLVVGVLCFLGMVLLLMGCLRYLDRYFMTLRPYERPKILATIKSQMRVSFVAVLFLIGMLLLPGNDFDVYARVDSFDDWNSNAYFGAVMMLEVYFAAHVLHYFKWRKAEMVELEDE